MTPLILVVDDSPVNREICRRSLQSSFEIVEAENGEQALVIAADRKPNLILLDIMMEGMDGFEVLSKLQEKDDTRVIPVLLLTAKGEIRDKQRGFQLGAEDYITKPFDRLELIARVEARLRKRMEEDIRIDKASQEARNKAVSQLLITMSHHINNALTILLGNIQIVNVDNPESVRKALTQVTNQTDRIRVVMEVLFETAEKMELQPMDDIGRKGYLFDIRDQLEERIEKLRNPSAHPDWV